VERTVKQNAGSQSRLTIHFENAPVRMMGG
jgi:hypothetical protein